MSNGNNIGIAPAKGKKHLKYRYGVTSDIIREVLDAVPAGRAQVAEFSRAYSPDRAGLYELFVFVRDNFQYKEDPMGVQWIREPARLYRDGVGDCKSYTLFILGVLENLGVNYIIRFSNTQKKGSKIVNHVYPIAILPNGEQVILDAVYKRFNAQAPFHYKEDYTMSEIYRLSGIGSTQAQEVNEYWDRLRKIDSEIPDSVLTGGDITEMTRGEFARFQQAQFFEAQAENASDSEAMRLRAAANAITTGNVSGLRSIGGYNQQDIAKLEKFLASTATQTQKAFSAPLLEIPDTLTGVGSLGDKIKDLASDVLNVWKKVLNWLFKTAMPLAAPFFIYTFLKKKFGKKTEAKKAKQLKVLNWIQKVGKFDDPSDVLNAVKTGIVKKFGKTPEAILDLASKGKISGFMDDSIGLVLTAILGAVSVVVEMIGKIADIFKKKDAEQVTASDAPDFQELAMENIPDPVPNAAPSPTPNKTPPPGWGDNGNQVALIAAAAVALYFITQKN